MSHFITTGASGGQTQSAAASERREINDLINDVPQFSLYIQALSMLSLSSNSLSIGSLIFE
jgi:tyrosinase